MDDAQTAPLDATGRERGNLRVERRRCRALGCGASDGPAPDCSARSFNAFVKCLFFTDTRHVTLAVKVRGGESQQNVSERKEVQRCLPRRQVCPQSQG